MSGDCSVSGTVSYADPSDCTKFYQCSSNSPPVKQSCPAGTVYNPKSQVCDWPYNVPGCGGTATTTTTAQPTTTGAPGTTTSGTIIRDTNKSSNNPFFCQTGGTTSGRTVTGVCSYYGGPEEPGLEGAYTASGEKFYSYLDTAAAMANYAWGAFNTTIHVYCADTGSSVTVRVNDRGNFAPRVLDLSYHAGTTIGITNGKGLCNTCVLTW